MKPLQKSCMNFVINFFQVHCLEVYLVERVPIFKNIKNSQNILIFRVFFSKLRLSKFVITHLLDFLTKTNLPLNFLLTLEKCRIVINVPLHMGWGLLLGVVLFVCLFVLIQGSHKYLICYESDVLSYLSKVVLVLPNLKHEFNNQLEQ